MVSFQWNVELLADGDSIWQTIFNKKGAKKQKRKTHKHCQQTDTDANTQADGGTGGRSSAHWPALGTSAVPRTCLAGNFFPLEKVDFRPFLAIFDHLWGLFRGSWRTIKGSPCLQGCPHMSQCSQKGSLLTFWALLETSIFGPPEGPSEGVKMA